MATIPRIISPAPTNMQMTINAVHPQFPCRRAGAPIQK